MTKIKAVMIIEVAGRPAEHVKIALKEHVEKLRSAKDVKLISYNVSEPKKIETPEQEQEFYSCFSEVEIETSTFLRLIEIVLDYMPSSIEILEPSEINFSLPEATSFLNDFSGRLHRYDEIAKIAQIQNQQLATKMQMMQQMIAQENALREQKSKEIKKVKKKSVKKKK